jgi:hypothetical protein
MKQKYNNNWQNKELTNWQFESWKGRKKQGKAVEALCIFLVIWSDEKYSEILQFTIPGGRHAVHHAGLLQEAGAGRVLRAAAAATTASIEAKIFARIVLRNLEHHQSGTSTWTPSRGASSNKQRPLHRWAAWPMQNEPVWLSEPFYITTVLACADSDWRNSTEGITHNCEVTEWNISGGPSRVGRLRLSVQFSRDHFVCTSKEFLALMRIINWHIA